MDYQALKARIGQPDCAGKTVADIAAILTTPNVPIVCDVSVVKVKQYMLLRGIIFSAKGWLAANPTGAAAPAVSGLLDTVTSSDIPSFQMTDSNTAGIIRQMMGAMQAVGVMSTQQAADILAMATVMVTPASQIGCGELAQMDLASAEYHIGVAGAL